MCRTIAVALLGAWHWHVRLAARTTPRCPSRACASHRRSLAYGTRRYSAVLGGTLRYSREHRQRRRRRSPPYAERRLGSAPPRPADRALLTCGTRRRAVRTRALPHQQRGSDGTARCRRNRPSTARVPRQPGWRSSLATVAGTCAWRRSSRPRSSRSRPARRREISALLSRSPNRLTLPRCACARPPLPPPRALGGCDHCAHSAVRDWIDSAR